METFDYTDFNNSSNSQACDLDRGVTLGTGHKVRVQVHVDSSYHNQSRATAQVWNGLNGWMETARLIPEKFAAEATLTNRVKVTEQAAALLLERTRALLDDTGERF